MTDLLAPGRGVFASRYEIEGELGHGATAAVYLARDVKHDRHVALKVLRPELAASLESARFLREIRLLAGLQHPHILPLFDSGESDGLLYFVMPRVGETLGQRLRRDGRLPVDEALRIAREVADALAYAHAHGVVHRDIKPDNILLGDAHALVADFGIARAVHRATDTGGDRITSAGLAIGTPAYMSPEQASGEHEIDGRSDIYSLACVLYEMLAGRTPFHGPTLQAMIARRFAGPPEPVRSLRSDVPREVDDALVRALAPSPALRFQTVRELRAALPPAAEEGSAARRPWWRRWRTAGVVVLPALVLLALLVERLLPDDPPLDPALYVVLPFEHPAGASDRLSGEQCELFLSEALGRWTDIAVVDPISVKDARARLGAAPLTLERAIGLAAGLGAGRLVWGNVTELRDTLLVRATLYDVASRRTIRHDLLRTPAHLGDALARFGELADRLLVGVGRSRRPDATRSLSAWLAYDEGHTALGQWSLAAAERGFARAAEIDPGFADAHLWKAQVIALAGDGRLDELRDAAARALSRRDRLPDREARLAEALLALGEGRLPEACDRFERFVARDRTDFMAWFGLGECLRLDRLVVRDARSPSGWRFRSSYRGAIEAYRQALQLTPSAHLAFRGPMLSRLSGLLVAEANIVRRGYALEPDTAWFLAFPSLRDDTLAFVPFRAEDVAAARPDTRSTTLAAAVAANQRILLEIARGWTASFPESPDAREALAIALEAVGEPGRDGALAEVRRAAALAAARADEAQSLRLAIAGIRLLVKSADFAAARGRADSLLAAHPDPSPEVALRLRGVAALLGRVETAAALARRSAPLQTFVGRDWRVHDVPPILAEAGAALLAYASLGAPADSIVALERRIAETLPSYVAAGARDDVGDALTLLPAALVFPVLGPRAAHREPAPATPLLRMQAALARGDTAAMRALLAELREYRAPVRPGDVAIDGTLQEALLLLAAGDTAGAEGHLDLSLGALSTLGSALLDELPQAAALPRAMALRAELAARRGDRASARRWARAADALWSGAEAPLRSAADRVHALAGS